MRGKKLLFFFSILCLGWIAYVSYNFLTKKNLYSIEELFGKEDREVLIINRPAEFQEIYAEYQNESNAYSIVHSILPNLSEKTQITVSRARKHFHINANEIWNEKKVRLAFAGHPLTFNSPGKFSFDGYQGIIKKNIIYVYSGELKTSRLIENWADFDMKASAVTINFEKPKSRLTEIYFKNETLTEYISTSSSIDESLKVDDKMLFSAILPASVKNYHFYEKYYLAAKDPIFKSGSMIGWIDKGLVEFEYLGQKVIVTDYLPGQQAGLILRDLNPDMEFKDDDFYAITALKDNLSFDPQQGFYMKELDDYVILSKTKEPIDQLIADYKLGKTISQNPEIAYLIYGDLPAKVSERYAESNSRVSKSVYDGKLFEMRYSANQVLTKPGQRDEVYKFSAEGIVSDFVVFKDKGKIALINNSNKLIYFENGQKKWDLELGNEGSLISMELIDVFENGKEQILLTNTTTIHVIDILGRELNGFPVKAESAFSNPTTFYTWKGNGYFLNSEQNKISVFDSKGGELNKIKTSLDNITQATDVWLSNRTLFYGAGNGSEFVMIEAEKSREYRKFNVGSAYTSIKNPNELFLFTLENSVLNLYDQKGTKVNLSSFKNGKITGKADSGTLEGFLLRAGNNLHLLNSKGIESHTIKVPFNEIEDQDVLNVSGKIYFGVVDGLENNVYLYDSKGKKLNPEIWEGSETVKLSALDNKILITTIIENYVIQYIK